MGDNSILYNNIYTRHNLYGYYSQVVVIYSIS